MKHILLLVITTFFLSYPLEASFSKEEIVEEGAPTRIQYTRDQLLHLEKSPLSKLPLHIDLKFYHQKAQKSYKKYPRKQKRHNYQQ